MLCTDKHCFQIYIDGPFGAPASNIFRAEHAVLVATGIGVTPFSSILQSIMWRYRAVKRQCPRCDLKWNDNLADSSAVQNLRKVDFFWINRDQKSFEWFLSLLNQMESEQAMEDLNPLTEGLRSNEEGSSKSKRFLDIHMYFTAALKSTDMRAVGLQVALDLLHAKVYYIFNDQFKNPILSFATGQQRQSDRFKVQDECWSTKLG